MNEIKKMRVSNDKYAQVATDAQIEAGWELFPAEVRHQMEYAAQHNIDEWLATGNTAQFAWE